MIVQREEKIQVMNGRTWNEILKSGKISNHVWLHEREKKKIREGKGKRKGKENTHMCVFRYKGVPPSLGSWAQRCYYRKWCPTSGQCPH